MSTGGYAEWRLDVNLGPDLSSELVTAVPKGRGKLVKQRHLVVVTTLWCAQL